MKLSLLPLFAASALFSQVALAQNAHAQINHGAMETHRLERNAPKTANASSQVATSSTRLPDLPPVLPRWLQSNKNHEVFYKRGAYNFAIYDIPALARDMNGVAVGHAMAYEALVTGREKTLEKTVFQNIDRVLKTPPKLMPAERFISPTFGRKYGVLELVFDWTHTSHAQTIDNFVSTYADNARKERETDTLWNHYKQEGAPFTLTGLPMNMAWLDSQPYSGAFRQKYPKVNALFWGYHWLQTSVYDGLRAKSHSEQKKMYAMLGARYRTVELYDTRRAFMPMMAETSPLFSSQYPEIANAFDNLHMLHDMVNDILASDWISDSQKKTQITRAIFIMSPDAHRACKSGENRGVIGGVSHDHRFMDGMRGMGMMKNGLKNTANPNSDISTSHASSENDDMKAMEHSAMPSTTSSTRLNLQPHLQVVAVQSNENVVAEDIENANEDNTNAENANAKNESTNNDEAGSDDESQSDEKAAAISPTELMWMPKMGWMNMSQCHHCSMPLPGAGEDADKAWQASTVSAEGWTMRVRCALCARDMSAETKGGAILSLSTEDPNTRITVFSDEEGNLTTESKGAVFIEEKAGHARCTQWSQAFTSRKAFEAYVKNNPQYADAKALTFEEWANVEVAETPETYFKEDGPVENPYAEDLKARGIESESESVDIETKIDADKNDSTKQSESEAEDSE